MDSITLFTIDTSCNIFLELLLTNTLAADLKDCTELGARTIRLQYITLDLITTHRFTSCQFLCLLSTESKTKYLHIVNLQVNYGQNIEEKRLTLEIRNWSQERNIIPNNMKMNQ